jgi:endonuclease/exonuclease/phosphatase family metal-dependent hydrolase
MTRLRVVTWNVRTCRSRDPDPDHVDLAGTVAMLRSIDADLIALQEVDREQDRSGGADQAAELGRALGMRHWYAAALLGPASPPSGWRAAGGSDPGGPAYGVALLSRLDGDAVATVPLPRPEPGEPRVALVAGVRAGARRLTVACTHLSFIMPDAAVQLHWLEGRLEAEPAPRLLLGDLNLWLPVVRLVSRCGWRPLAAGLTFPNRPPDRVGRSVQIDHVLASAGRGGTTAVRVLRTRVAAGPVSDHRALVADLEVGPARG